MSQSNDTFLTDNRLEICLFNSSNPEIVKIEMTTDIIVPRPIQIVDSVSLCAIIWFTVTVSSVTIHRLLLPNREFV